MRLPRLLLGDIRFQFKYGFFYLYLIFTILYVIIVSFLPAQWKPTIGPLITLTDPVALGLFFMGAIVLFEKSERVINTIAISPVKVSEYILSKLLSLSLISTAAGVIIAFAAGEVNHLLLLITGLLLGSCLFSLLGMIIASKASTLNGYILACVPVEIIAIGPAIAYLLGYDPSYMKLHPTVIIADFIRGQTNSYTWLLLLILCLWIVIVYTFTHRSVQRMLQTLGGAKL